MLVQEVVEACITAIGQVVNERPRELDRLGVTRSQCRSQDRLRLRDVEYTSEFRPNIPLKRAQQSSCFSWMSCGLRRKELNRLIRFPPQRRVGDRPSKEINNVWQRARDCM